MNMLTLIPLCLVGFFAFYCPPMVESFPVAEPPSEKPKMQIKLVEDNQEAVKAYFLRRKQHDLQWSVNTGGRINLGDPEVKQEIDDADDVLRAKRYVIASKASVRFPDPRMLAHKMGKRAAAAQYFKNEMDESEDDAEAVAAMEDKKEVEMAKMEEAEHSRRLALAAMLMGSGERYFKKTYGYGYVG